MPENVKSAVRVLEILEYFDGVRRDASVSEIANALGIPPSSTVGLLRSMVRMGYVVQDERRRYRLTSRVALLGNWIDGMPAAGSEICHLMEELSKATGETVTLGVPAGYSIKYVSVVPAVKPAPLRIMPGDTRPLATSGVGRLFLSTMPEPQVRQVIFRHNAMQHDVEGQLSLPTVLRDLASIRESGYVFSDRLYAGAALVCVALPHREAEERMAISISGRSNIISACPGEYASLIKTYIRRVLELHPKSAAH